VFSAPNIVPTDVILCARGFFGLGIASEHIVVDIPLADAPFEEGDNSASGLSDLHAIGVNESGKTNLLLPLWKLNPAHEGEIRPMSDCPSSDNLRLIRRFEKRGSGSSGVRV
jgi:hypothetical protein